MRCLRLRKKLRLRATAGSVGGPTIDSTILPPSLTLASAQTAYPPSFDIASLGDAIVGDTLRLARYTDDALTAGLVTYDHVILQADADAAAPRPITFTGLSAIASGTWRWIVYIVRGAVRSPSSNMVTSGPNDVAPVLSAFTVTNITDTSATVGCTTNFADGTLFHLRNTSPTAVATATIVSTGTSQAITASGAKTFSTTGATQLTQYYDHFAHAPAVGPTSLELIGTFTTIATPALSTNTIWNSADKSASVALTNTSRTATNSSGGWAGARGTTSKTSLKRYFEATITAGGSALTGVGVANSTAAFTTFVGADTNGFTYFASGNAFYNGGAVTAGVACAVGDVQMICVDIATSTIWIGRNGTWVGNPSAGTGGYTMSSIGTTLFCSFSDTANGGLTLNTGQTTFSYSLPTGASAWDL